MKNIFNEEILKVTLILAGIYNFLCAGIFIFFPDFLLDFLNTGSPELAQALGLFVGVLGIGFILASSDLQSHWGIVLLGILIKILSLLFFVKIALTGGFSFKILPVVIINDLIWLTPFYFALEFAYEAINNEESLPKKFSDLVDLARTNEGKTLSELSQDKKVLLVFVRHLGCTFCRETVDEISKLESVIKNKNFNLDFVHMSDPAYGDEFFSKYFSYPVSHISDPQRLLYQSLGLRRGTLGQLFGPSTFIRGFWAGVIKGHGLGLPEGDPMQLGGCFVLSKGRIVYERKTTNASDPFDTNIISEV